MIRLCRVYLPTPYYPFLSSPLLITLSRCISFTPIIPGRAVRPRGGGWE